MYYYLVAIWTKFKNFIFPPKPKRPEIIYIRPKIRILPRATSAEWKMATPPRTETVSEDFQYYR